MLLVFIKFKYQSPKKRTKKRTLRCTEHINLLLGTLFATHWLQFLHFRGDHWRSDEADLLNACRIGARLIVLDEQLNVLNALEFYEAQRNNNAVVERF